MMTVMMMMMMMAMTTAGVIMTSIRTVGPRLAEV
jgi:hypothetical protein